MAEPALSEKGREEEGEEEGRRRAGLGLRAVRPKIVADCWCRVERDVSQGKEEEGSSLGVTLFETNTKQKSGGKSEGKNQRLTEMRGVVPSSGADGTVSV